MSGLDIVRPVSTGILHIPAYEQRSGRFGFVGVLGESGLTVMRSVPAWDEAVLIAVLQQHRSASRRHWFGPGRTVYTRTVETPIVLGTGAVCTATTDPSGLADLIGVQHAGLSVVPWLDPVALARVVGQCVRLELHRPPQSRSATGRYDESA